MAADEVDWDVCQYCREHGGIGISLPSGGKCWAHADDQDLDAALKRLGEDGMLDARGVPVTTQLLGRLLQAAPASSQRRRWLGDVCFERATFEQFGLPSSMIFKGEARFAWATFNGSADFEGVTFTKKAEFAGVTFKSHASFPKVTFNGEASFEEATFGATASFTGATFDCVASFRMATFERTVEFIEVTFNRAAEFSWARFKDAAWFARPLTRDGDVEGQIRLEGALVLFPGFDPLEHGWVEPTEGRRRTVFNGEAQFGTATFDVLAWFHGVTFRRHADFKGVTFDITWFDKATFEDSANFDEVAVNGVAGFRGTAFRGFARFIGARFNGPTTFAKAIFTREAIFLFTEFSGALFDQTTFYDRAIFLGASFESRHLGPMVVGKELNLDEAVFSRRVRLEIAAATCSCKGTQFLAGVEFRARWAHLVLDDTGFVAPSLLSGVAPFNHIDETQFARAWAGLGRPSGIQDGRPRLLSLQRADAAQLSISNVDLAACRFAAAHNLDQFHIERSTFGSTPNGRRWTARQTIAEEHHWRSRTAATWRRRGWYDQSIRPPAWLKVEPLDAAQIAALYRALRKGREDSKDEPGAADFYYGEMEMRRHAAPRFSVEWAVLTLYWLVAGYALRAWRAFVTLGAVLVLAAWLLAHCRGFATPHAMTFWSALRYSGRTAIGLLPKEQPTLTPWGDVLQIAVRVLVPVLLGLAALSIRGRVKR